ncbi:DeoR family transcriptional regulator [Candidatus Peregrinibacteria bacterium]|jgi:heat-inducible transcriptional repressor|nr:DeoR family transcriptional regulator [Candidatus Peregrinibacteria bacterium]MBT7703272.1 DeoR family transcriptional regulator [Candidatus Peregrinibacteria bacterium]
MLPIDPRKEKILNAIIQHFIGTAEPVGSKTVLIKYNLSVSPATIRNDMAFLENEGLISQPHTSAGRIPTEKGYRMYVEKLADYKKAERLAKENLKKLRVDLKKRRAQQQVYEAVSILAQAMPNISFASIPENRRTFYLGVSNMLRQPEFLNSPINASQVMEVLEEGVHLLKTLDQLELDDQPHIFIGKENILPQMESCSLIVSKYNIDGFEGYLGLLGPTRMPYAFNFATLKEVLKMLQNDQ